MKIYSIAERDPTRRDGFLWHWFGTKAEAQKALHDIPADGIDEYEFSCTKAGVVQFLNGMFS